MSIELKFSGLNIGSEINELDFRNKIINIISEILIENHSIPEKQKILNRFGSNRINFACPYCGDSAVSSIKKRGNIFLNNYYFHCFNCNTHVSLIDFLKDFDKTLNSNEVVYVKNTIENSKILNNEKFIDNSFFIDIEIFEKYAIEKDIIFKAYNLLDINSLDFIFIKNYLLDRHQNDMNYFGWDNERKRLFIFNLTSSNKVIGMQARNFDKRVPMKYLTYNTKKIYEKIKKPFDENNEKLYNVNKLSLLFNLLKINFRRKITITEGPLDSFLINNAVSICGIDNEFPFEISNIRWMYDRDKPGINKAIEKIKLGEEVFLWKKFIEDLRIGEILLRNKIDYTDLITYLKIYNKSTMSINNYFSNNKYDIHYI